MRCGAIQLAFAMPWTVREKPFENFALASSELTVGGDEVDETRFDFADSPRARLESA